MEISTQNNIPSGKQGTATTNYTSPDKLLVNLITKSNQTSEEATITPSESDSGFVTETKSSSPVPQPLNTTTVETTPINKPIENTDPFSELRELYGQINTGQLQETMLNNAKMLQFSSSTFYRDQGNYIESLAPVVNNLLFAIQNNDRNGVYNALSQALDLASGLKSKRANNTGYKDLIDEANTEKRIYQNILNDPNMIDLSNPQHAMQFLTQTMMWTNGGSLPDYMHELSNSLGANTIFYDPKDTFSNYDF